MASKIDDFRERESRGRGPCGGLPKDVCPSNRNSSAGRTATYMKWFLREIFVHADCTFTWHLETLFLMAA